MNKLLSEFNNVKNLEELEHLLRRFVLAVEPDNALHFGLLDNGRWLIFNHKVCKLLNKSNIANHWLNILLFKGRVYPTKQCERYGFKFMYYVYLLVHNDVLNISHGLDSEPLYA